MDYGSWWLNHPIKAVLLFAGITFVVMPIGPGAAWLTESLHWVSPNNVLAGFGMGMGGAILGMASGLLAVMRVRGDSKDVASD